MVWAPHVTVASIVGREGRFLMVEEEADGRLVYNQPAGHLEPGESLLDAVARETLEETGVTFAPTHLVGIYRWTVPEDADRTYLRFCFAGSAVAVTSNPVLDAAVRRVLWLSRPDLEELGPHLRSPMVLRCIDDYLTGKHHSLDLLHDVS